MVKLNGYRDEAEYIAKNLVIMPAIKIIDKTPRETRRKPCLWECFGLAGINPTEIKEGKGIYYAIVQQEKIEEVLKNDVKEDFANAGFEIQTPIEYNALRSIVIRHIDKAIQEYTDEEIIASINEANQWADVESIYKITETGRLLKVRFKSAKMVITALNEGIVVINQKIPPRNIEREIFIRLTPCCNCYSYEHKTRNCDKEKQVVCAYCAEQGHHAQNCTAASPKCINCGTGHRTLAAACPQRKELIKAKSKEIRDRSRSRSRTRTYAQVSAVRQQGQPQDPIIVDSSTTKKLVSKILTAIVYAHFVESTKPGSFQETMDQMFDLNGLPRVNFPTEIVVTNLEEIYRDTIGVQPQTEREERQQRPKDTTGSEDRQRQIEDMQIEQPKRQRESLSPGVMVQEQKRKKDT